MDTLGTPDVLFTDLLADESTGGELESERYLVAEGQDVQHDDVCCLLVDAEVASEQRHYLKVCKVHEHDEHHRYSDLQLLLELLELDDMIIEQFDSGCFLKVFGVLCHNVIANQEDEVCD